MRCIILNLGLSFGLLCPRKRRLQQSLVLILSCIFSVAGTEIIHPTDVVVFEGQNAFFEYSSPVNASSWTWFRTRHGKAARLYNDGKYVIFVNGMRTASNLTVLNVTRADDQTKYHYERDHTSSNSANLTVITPLDTNYPKCTITNSTDNIHVGENVEIVCTAIGGIPRPSLHWFKNNIKLKEDEDFTSGANSVTYLDMLSILLSNEDNGVEFKCKADGISVVHGNQSCSVVPLSIQPNVSIIVTKMSYDAGDSLNITCSGEGIPRISEYNWFFNNKHVTSSQSMFNIIKNGTILEILQLQTEHLNAEIRCKVSIPSGLSANKSITLSFTSHDAATNDLIIYIVSGSVLGLLILLGLLVVCTKTKIKRNHEKNSKVTTSHYVNHDVSLNQVELKEDMNKDWYSSGEPHPQHPMPMLGSKSVENILYISDIKHNQGLSSKETYSLENISKERPDRILLSTSSIDHLYAKPDGEPQLEHPMPMHESGSVENILYSDVPDIKHNQGLSQKETCSMENISRERPDRILLSTSSIDHLYAEPEFKNLRKHNPDTQSIDGIADFGDLYAKPIKEKQKPDTRSIDGIADFGDLYAKPIKEKQNPDTQSVDGIADFGDLYAKPIKHRQSIHQSLENILGSSENDNTSSNRSESVDDLGLLYSKPNKNRVTSSTEHLPQLYIKPDRTHKEAFEGNPTTYTGRPGIESNVLSNNIKLDVTYSSIA
ncbi:uncharacterized protein LOC117102367 [Anneissia japonica]|uniref:uncharacterized protein LOC117102367 n=1 Tax=Anneissia japonica TaxID=1529436 RepID=UPI001425B8F2|nr:uncharacterized protein LOC117102367 [Anneissia japonica]